MSSTVDCGNVGLVVQQVPTAGTLVAPGTAVSLTFGVEPPPPFVCQ